MEKNKICRACLVENISQSIKWSLQLDSAKAESITYMECFQRCTLLDVDPQDQLPQVLCLDCAAQLRDIYDFVRKATESHQALLLKLFYEETAVENFECVTVEKTEIEDDEETAGENFECVTVEKTEIEDDDELLFTNSKTCSMNVDQELTADSDGNNDYEPKPSNNSTTAQKDSEAIIPSAKTLKRRKRGRPRLTSQSEMEKLDAQDNDIIKCDFCSGTFFTQKQMRRHVSYAHNSKMHLCHACPRTFKDPGSLRQHALTHEENRQRNYTCEHCGKKFLTKAYYQNHVKIHDTNRKAAFQCTHCEKSFLYKGGLKLHMLYHTGEMLECKICTKKFPRLYDLEVHLRSHSGDLPYKCMYCDKAFIQAGALNKHVRRHHEDYRYKCDMCNKEYLHQSSLFQHKQEHMGLPLICLICGKGFVNNSKIKRHLNGVHKISNEKMDEFIQKAKAKRK